MAKLPALVVDPDEVGIWTGSTFCVAFEQVFEGEACLQQEEMEFGGFMDSNLFGQAGGPKGSIRPFVLEVKSEEQMEAFQVKLAKQIAGYVQASEDGAQLWEDFCMAADLDPDSEDSRRVRGEMATRIELGRRKTPLESFLEAAPRRSRQGWRTWVA